MELIAWILVIALAIAVWSLIGYGAFQRRTYSGIEPGNLLPYGPLVWVVWLSAFRS